MTKLERIQFDSREAQQAATMRKMLVAMARDLRVLVIKLADRLHNMRTIAAMPTEKQLRIAQETLDIYAPLAHRLGMQEIKQQLEDLSFAALHPKRFAELDHLVSSRAPDREVYLATAITEVEDAPRRAGHRSRGDRPPEAPVEPVREDGRQGPRVRRHLRPRRDPGHRRLDEGLLRRLGCIHGRWRPVVGRFKDYIAMPKFNLYQSLHTTVIGPEGKPIEVQIRTREMHQRAEWGVAAHWAYKDESPSADIDWLNRIIDWQAEVSDPAQFMQSLKTDLEQDEVFVFTPKGRVVTLPSGRRPSTSPTPCTRRSVTPASGPRSTAASSRSTISSPVATRCEIFTSKVETAGPSRDWLGFVKSPRARNKIRQWFSRERRLDMIEAGRDALAEELRREGLPVQRMWASEQLKTVIADHSYVDLDALLAAIGEHHVSARSVAQRVGQRVPRRVRTRSSCRPPCCDRGAIGPSSDKVGVHVEGLDDVLVRLAKCCTPVPGDEIIGFVTRGRGVSVHRADCANAVTLMSEHATRLIEVDWDGEASGSVYRAGVEVVALDRSRLLRDVANALAEHHVNIVSCDTSTGLGSRRQDALRVRARRPQPARGGPADDQGDRRRL